MSEAPVQPISPHTDPCSADAAAIRLLLDALVRRLNSQPLELAERALRHDSER